MTYDGIHFNIPEAEYRAAPGVNQSTLKKIIPPYTPAHYKSAIDSRPKPPTDDQITGTLVHQAFFDGRKGGWAVRPPYIDLRNAEGKEWRKANPGHLVNFDIGALVEALRANPDVASVMKFKGHFGVAGWKTHGPTGLLLKGLADWLTVDSKGYTVCIDLKTVQEECSDGALFAKEIKKRRYDIQDVQYRHIFGAIYFIFIVVEKAPPYVSAVYYIDAERIQYATDQWDDALRRLARCQRENQWPARPQGINECKVWVEKKD